MYVTSKNQIRTRSQLAAGEVQNMQYRVGAGSMMMSPRSRRQLKIQQLNSKTTISSKGGDQENSRESLNSYRMSFQEQVIPKGLSSIPQPHGTNLNSRRTLLQPLLNSNSRLIENGSRANQ